MAEGGRWQTDSGCAAALTTLSGYGLYCRVIAMRPSRARIALFQYSIYMRRSHGIHSAGSSFGGHGSGAHHIQTPSPAFVALNVLIGVRGARRRHLAKAAAHDIIQLNGNRAGSRKSAGDGALRAETRAALDRTDYSPQEKTERISRYHRVLHRLRWIARVRRILSGRRLHVLDNG
jgi:hypothetical protein